MKDITLNIDWNLKIFHNFKENNKIDLKKGLNH